MSYCPDSDWQLEIARRMTSKDHKQRWVYYCRTMKCYRISDTPMPYVDKISVRWMPIVGAVAYTHVPAALAHPAI